jgi:hypothetical protein
MTLARLFSGGASARWATMFSVNTIPMSTIVPIAIAMPARAITFASTPVAFMVANAARTASGSTAEISNEVLKLRSITSTMITVTRICWKSAVESVSRVSCMSVVRS